MRLNFRNIGEGIGALGDAYNKVQLGRRYDEASKQTMQPGVEGTDEEKQRAAEEANKLQLEDFETFANQPDRVRGDLGANYRMDVSTTASPTKYGLGANPTEFRTTQYTPAERRTAGLEAQADFLAKQGRTEEASKLLDTVEARKTGALNQQLLQENVNNAGLRKRALEQGLEVGQQNLTAGQLGIDASQRTARQNKDLDALGILMARAERLPPDSQERFDLDNEIKSKTAGLSLDAQSSMVALAKNRMELKKNTDEADYIRSASSPEAFVKHYNEKLRDGSTAEIIKNKDGTTSIVTYKEGDKANTQERFRFKAWGDTERNQVLGASPAFAKAKFEADIAHANKIAQIQVTGRLANERTAMIVKGKDIKISPESRTELTEINARRTELLSKGEALTPDEEKELKRLDIRQDSVLQTLAIDNNQIAALLRSGDSRYRTDNPPPRAGGRQSELTPAEYDATKEQLRARLTAERGQSFTGMSRDQQETFLNQEMDKKYTRKGLTRSTTPGTADRRFPTQGATTRDSSSNAAADISARLRAVREADID